MAFILRSTKYVNNFIVLARRSSLTFRRKRVPLLDYNNFFRFSELWPRTAATAAPAPKPVLAFPFNSDKAITHLYNNLKASMIDLYTVELTLDSLKANGVMTPAQLVLLLKCCGSAAFRESEEDRIILAQKVWETSKNLGLIFDISHYNTLISVFLENNFKFSPEKILSDIKDAGLEPNVVTYRRLLKAYCQQGNILGASEMLEQMKNKKFSINEYDFCSLIQGHCELGELDEAAKIFNVMKERGIKPTLDPYVYLLCGYAKHGNIEKMEKLLDELKDQDLYVTDTYLLNIVYTLIVNDREEYVDSILNRMNKSSNYEKTLMVVVHRLLHKNKDNEAMKLFAILTGMSYGKTFIKNQVDSIIDHFVYYRTPLELSKICQKMQEEGWSPVAFSQGLKKAVLRKDLEYCKALITSLRHKGFPIRSHYFWPLITRYSEWGNEGILSVLKEMKALHVLVCPGTMKLYVKDYYKFSKNWEVDLENFKNYGVMENYVSLIILQKALEEGNLNKAELIASSCGVLRPEGVTITLLVNCLANSSSHEEFLNILYYLAHDIAIYSTKANGEENNPEEDGESTELTTFFDDTLKALIENCPKDIFLKMLQNASGKKLLITPKSAQLIRENFPLQDVDVLLKKFEPGEFELDKELLKKKFEKANVSKTTSLSSRIANFTYKNSLEAEKLYEKRGSEASIGDHLRMLSMYVRMNLFDKAFAVIERMKDLPGKPAESPSNPTDRNFRSILWNLSKSGNIERIIDAYNVGVRLGLIGEEYVLPVIRVALRHVDIDTALEQYPEIFEKIKTASLFFKIMNELIPAGNPEAINKLTDIYAKTVNRDAALTALFTAYLSNDRKSEARKVLENNRFSFQIPLFFWWFRSSFMGLEKSFEETMDVVKELKSEDRIVFYGLLQRAYERSRDLEKLKMLWVQCQEDNVSEPQLLEQLSKAMRQLEGGFEEPESDEPQSERFSGEQKNGKHKWSKILGLIKEGKYSEKTLHQLLSTRLPLNIARKVLPVLAAEGKSSELNLIMSRNPLGQFIPEIASIMLKNNKIDQFMQFVTSEASLGKYGDVYNSFASQKPLILNQIKIDEDFFQKLKELAVRCYEESGHETLLVFLMKLCVEVPGKIQETEELLHTADSHLVSHFRNYAVSNSSSKEVDFYKNVLESEKVKSVFSEALDHLYDRIIKYYNENGDLENALSYLEKAKLDGVEEKLDKELISSLKKNLEDRGTTFPYPQLLQEAA